MVKKGSRKASAARQNSSKELPVKKAIKMQQCPMPTSSTIATHSVISEDEANCDLDVAVGTQSIGEAEIDQNRRGSRKRRISVSSAVVEKGGDDEQKYVSSRYFRKRRNTSE
jgi:hypothetical protein